MDSDKLIELSSNTKSCDDNVHKNTFSGVTENTLSHEGSTLKSDVANGNIVTSDNNQSNSKVVLLSQKDHNISMESSNDLTSTDTKLQNPFSVVSNIHDQPACEKSNEESIENVTMLTSEGCPSSSAGETNCNVNELNESASSVTMNEPTMPTPFAESRNSEELLDNKETANLQHVDSNSVNDHSDKSDVQTENLSEMPAMEAASETGKDEGVTTTIVVEEINIKQEPPDDGYGKVELLHRGQPIVVYSDDEDADKSSSSSGSSYVPPIEDRLNEFDEGIGEEEAEEKTSSKLNIYKNKSRTEGEVFPEELPPMEYLMISPDESVELEPLGVVSGVVDVLVVVRADNNSPALYDDTILFVEGRKPLGLIFETFGTVEKPYYSVRFNSAADIAEKGIEVGQRVYFAPKADNLTKYVFIAELRKVKFDDASWKNDNEVPASCRDYSDDEEERKEKRRAKNKERGISDKDTNEENPLRRKKKKRPGQDVPAIDSDSNRPNLLPGQLNRNPFGAQGQRFNGSSSSQWLPPSPTNNSGPRGPRGRSPFSAQPPPPDPHMFNTPPPPRPGPPVANFGQNPRWPPRHITPPFSGPPPFPAPTCPPAVGHSPFSAAAPPTFVPFGQRPFSGSQMPTFSSPYPPPFPPSNGSDPPFCATQSPVTPPVPPPQWSSSFPPPPPSNFFGLRPANFNPSVPPPRHHVVNNNPQRFHSNSQASK